MPSLPAAAHTWVGGDDATSGNLQTLTDWINFLQDPPKCRLYYDGTGSQSTTGPASGTPLVVTWQTELWDVPGFHAAGATSIIPTYPGLYLVRARVQFASNATGPRQVQIKKNAAGTNGGFARVQAVNGATTTVEVNTEIYCNGTTDALTAEVVQTSGGTLALAGSNSFDSEFSATWKGVS